ncbi:hypothetical protein BGW80DRAFT_1266242 [Lactifluus volemus]|nr:hypothetical protein BGW80DRAFT_1266242 [Lactifluus volemus]
MTVPSPDQVVTIIEQVQNSIEVVSHLEQLVQGLTTTRNPSPELQQSLCITYDALGTMNTECQRYFKKRGLMRVSAMLPKRVKRKKIERNLGYLREKVHDIHNDFEKRLDNVRHEESNTAGPSNVTMSGRVAKQTDSRITIPQRFPAASREIITASITEQRIGQGDIKQNLTSTSTFFSFGQATGTAEIDAESDEWVTDGPEDWAASLTNMRESVQSCAASILGQPQHGPGARHRHTPRHTTRASGSKGVSPSTQSNLTLDLRRLETRLLMGILSFTPPDVCPPNDQFQAIKLTPSYPVVISGYYSWDAAVRRAIDVGSPEVASKLFDLAQILEDLCMHDYSLTVATWAVQLRRGLYHSDKDMHRRDLASALSLKARTLAGIGKMEGAIIAARGAVQLCYEDQALQGGQLAKALQKSEAKVVAMETVEVLRALGEDKPHLKHFLSLARASISDILVDMEEYDEALAMTHAAIKSARTLIGVVDSRPALTIALLVRARALAARGEKASAYVAGVQAIRYLRDLASERPTFTTFLAHALPHSSRYLHAAGFYWEARKHAEESVELYRTLHASAPQAFVRQYAEAVGYVVQLRIAEDNVGGEVFDMAQLARDLYREASIHDSVTLAVILGVIASSLLEVGRLQEAAAPAMEAVGIFKDRWTHDPDRYVSPLVGALRLASSCLPGTEGGLEYAKEAVEVHRERKDLERGDHDGVLTHLLMEVFSRLRELGREVEAIPWKTEAAKLNGDIVESSDPPEAQFKGLPDGILEYSPGSGDDDDDGDDIKDM